MTETGDGNEEVDEIEMVAVVDSEGIKFLMPFYTIDNALTEYEYEAKAENEILDISDGDIPLQDNWIANLFIIQTKYEANPSALYLYEALGMCNESQIPLPIWLLEGLRGYLASTFSGEVRGSKGRANGVASRSREQWKVAARRQTVACIRKLQRLQHINYGLIGMAVLSNPVKKYLTAHPAEKVGTTVQRAIELAEASLRGTFAQASAETIRKAWVSRRGTDDQNLFEGLKPETLEAFGMSVFRTGGAFAEYMAWGDSAT